jgi:hypothetical protein
MDRAAQREAGEGLGWTLVFVVVLLAVIALVTWPLHRVPLALTLAAGLGGFLLLVAVAAHALGMLQGALKVNPYDHADAFLLGNLAVSALLVVGWAGFAALAVTGAAAGAPVWAAAILHAVGLVATHLGYSLVSSFWPGTFYRYKNLPIAAAAYVLFAAWPAAARLFFGWLSGV